MNRNNSTFPPPDLMVTLARPRGHLQSRWPHVRGRRDDSICANVGGVQRASWAGSAHLTGLISRSDRQTGGLAHSLLSVETLKTPFWLDHACVSCGGRMGGGCHRRFVTAALGLLEPSCDSEKVKAECVALCGGRLKLCSSTEAEDSISRQVP